LINAQHTEDCDFNSLSDLIYLNAVKIKIPNVPRDVVIINKDSGFTHRGFSNDTGLTSRKIIMDTCGDLAPHGGGAFSGKRPK
jgi:S-adenosylmethionine synthetase